MSEPGKLRTGADSKMTRIVYLQARAATRPAQPRLSRLGGLPPAGPVLNSAAHAHSASRPWRNRSRAGPGAEGYACPHWLGLGSRRPGPGLVQRLQPDSSGTNESSSAIRALCPHDRPLAHAAGPPRRWWTVASSRSSSASSPSSAPPISGRHRDGRAGWGESARTSQSLFVFY
jgi:hypothetical protein